MPLPRAFETRLVHDGEPHVEGAVAMPVFHSSTFIQKGGGVDYHDIRYGRLSNTPSHLALHRKLASIEGAEDALVTASGMAAISTALLTVAHAGDHVLVQNVLYGGTHGLVVNDFLEFGIAFDVIDPRDPSGWKEKLRPTTRALYVETISNPLLGVGELDAAVSFARENGLVSMIDNTFASPVNFRPVEHGFDLSLHSATKYLNGHSDVIAGAVIGRRELVARVKRRLDHLGGSLDPNACYLLQRGMKTLALRVARQNANAMSLARFFEDHPAVERVHYPGLESHPDHDRARRHLDGFGGMVSIELRGGARAARDMVNRLTVALEAPSLGGLETLVSLPVEMSHASLTPEERKATGISDGLVRISVGIEAVEDLIADFRNALER